MTPEDRAFLHELKKRHALADARGLTLPPLTDNDQRRLVALAEQAPQYREAVIREAITVVTCEHS